MLNLVKQLPLLATTTQKGNIIQEGKRNMASTIKKNNYPMDGHVDLLEHCILLPSSSTSQVPTAL